MCCVKSDAGSFKVVSSFYFHSSSFRKIEGNKCVGGTEKDFFPVRTPCPVQGKGCTTCMYGVYNGCMNHLMNSRWIFGLIK